MYLSIYPFIRICIYNIRFTFVTYMCASVCSICLKGWAYIRELTSEAVAHDILVESRDSPVVGSRFIIGCHSHSIHWFPAS